MLLATAIIYFWSTFWFLTIFPVGVSEIKLGFTNSLFLTLLAVTPVANTIAMSVILAQILNQSEKMLWVRMYPGR